ncbi:MAG: ribose-5-phosphate isomerase RpiA [Chloroflexi bacterium]|nr:ribose-5-phosphate isomerase RpiA [Chloroflexota bacterium]
MDADALKRIAGERAAALVQDGMRVGLGTGSTATWAVRALGDRAASGLHFVGVATSVATQQLAESLHLAMATLGDAPALDIDIDGADELDPSLNAVKGHGGALLREKLVALAARAFVVVVDESKVVSRLGEKMPVPVEVVRYGWESTRSRVERLGCQVTLRMVGDEPFTTDEGHFILDCAFGVLERPSEVASALKLTTGVVEHGLFLDLVAKAIIAHRDGTIEVRRR